MSNEYLTDLRFFFKLPFFRSSSNIDQNQATNNHFLLEMNHFIIHIV